MLPSTYKGPINPNGGFLCLSMHWRPEPSAPDPEIPGQKLSMASYLPTAPDAPCLCGSGQAYRDCCRRQRHWYPICPNPGFQGYSLVALQSATFTSIDGARWRERLLDDNRLHCAEDSPQRGFWLYWGDPAVDDQYGTLCFGDVELKNGQTLYITAMSDVRMQALLDLLTELATAPLPPPKMSYDKVEMIDKVTGKHVKLRPPRTAR
jgi:SEC-C motif